MKEEICLSLSPGIKLDTQEYLCIARRVERVIEDSIGEYPEENTITGIWPLPLDYYRVVVEKVGKVFTITEAKPLDD